MSTGNKYHRLIHQLAEYNDKNGYKSIIVDVYSVLNAFKVWRPGLQHCAKKILCAGLRGKGSELQDLIEARDALNRAIEDVERECIKEPLPIKNKLIINTDIGRYIETNLPKCPSPSVGGEKTLQDLLHSPVPVG